MHLLLIIALLASEAFSKRVPSNSKETQICRSYGIDIQDHGLYFQNITSLDPFTFVSVFEGCQDDAAYNILVGPSGEEYQCTNTRLKPNDLNQLSTCPIEKHELTSGAWSVIIISNNGNATPIAYERDFYLSVGVPATVLYTPTVTVKITSTPTVKSTILRTSLSTILETTTFTQPQITESPTIIITPPGLTITTTKSDGTIVQTSFAIIPILQTSTHTQTCAIPTRQPFADPWIQYLPTIRPWPFLPPQFQGGDRHGWLRDRKQRMERKHNIGHQKRTLDVPTLSLTESNTSAYKTSTATAFASVETVRVTSLITELTIRTVTSTRLPETALLSVETLTAPTPTQTLTEHILVTSTVTVTKRPTLTVTVATAPAWSTVFCRAVGGKLI